MKHDDASGLAGAAPDETGALPEEGGVLESVDGGRLFDTRPLEQFGSRG